ncbi:MAG: winged helix-turn-helix domain-containing protein [Acidobacteriota bacterium]|nr:winged helix-turn-helix domain-containing protein [Acidobacteriota bacterium]
MARVSFDRFEFNPATLELRADGAPVALQQQPARVLALLVARPGELVTRDALRQAIWGDGTFVDFNRSLNFCVSQIRGALDDDAEAPRFVETLRGRGYRFVWQVKQAGQVRQVSPVPQVRRVHWVPVAVAAALLVGVVTWAVLALGDGEAKAVAIAPFQSSAGGEEWSETLRAQIVGHLAHAGTRVVDPGLATASGSGRWYLDARVDRSDEQYRVLVTLHDPAGTVRFTDIFDGPPGDWIEAQNEMARIISQAVRYNVEGPRVVEGIDRRAPRRKIPFS